MRQCTAACETARAAMVSARTEHNCICWSVGALVGRCSCVSRVGISYNSYGGVLFAVVVTAWSGLRPMGSRQSTAATLYRWTDDAVERGGCVGDRRNGVLPYAYVQPSVCRTV